MLRLRGVVQVPFGRAVLKWASEPDRSYVIEHATDLPQGFSVLATNLPATPPQNVYTGRVDSKAEFFRVRLETP